MSSDQGSPEYTDSEEDTIKILLATDIHLGYEHSTKRLQENDSFLAFEEILQHAQQEDVDLILLGGDLFHDSKPSQKVILQCMQLLRKYAMGDRHNSIELLTNPDLVFPHLSSKLANYEDPNLNIAIPIFSIHGNHDNPSFETTGSMDILSASGLINYFGKWSSVTSLTIPPLMIKKGETYVSIYGLSYINDQRLSRLLRDEQFYLALPSGVPEPFKLLVLHQNRSKHTENGFIPEDKLPECLDLVFWGHEHECRVEPEQIEDKTIEPPRRYYITQPGSSVATSLCQGEAREKKIGLLKVKGRHFKIQPIKLKTVRPFVFEDLCLRTVDLEADLKRAHCELVYEHVDDYIEHILLPKAREQLTDNPNQPKVPLIRLRIFYTKDTELFDAIKLSRKYVDRIANPRDMIIFRKEKGHTEDDKRRARDRDDDMHEEMSECFRTSKDDDWNRTIQGGIRNYFAREDKKNNLKVLSVGGLNEALRSFVEMGDDEAFKLITDHQLKKSMGHMKQFDVDEEPEIIEQLKVYREERDNAEHNKEEEKEAKQFLSAEAGKSRKKATQSNTSFVRDNSDVESDDHDDEVPSPTRGRGRSSRGRVRGARATATTRGSTRGRGRAATGTTALDVSVSSFAPKASSSMKQVKLADVGVTMTQLRTKTANQSKKVIYIDDSDSD